MNFKRKKIWDWRKSFHRNRQISFPLSPNYTVNNIIYINCPTDIETLKSIQLTQKSLSWWGKGTTSIKKKAWEEKAHSIYFYTIIYSSTIFFTKMTFSDACETESRLCYSWELNNSSTMQRKTKWRHGGHMSETKRT